MTTTSPTPVQRYRALLAGTTAYLRPLAWASLISNMVLVVTGGAVRLTDSGLGCPTWPRCTDSALTPRNSLSIHSAIEFGNRMLTFVLVIVAVATLIAAWQTHRRELRRLSLGLMLGIPAQAIIGGISVLTHLNPWIVSVHLLCSLAMICLAVLLVRLVDQPGPLAAATAGAPTTKLAWSTFGAGWLVLYVGTVVTGSGPHAGDRHAHRNGLSPLQLAQLHADLVFLFVGLTVGLIVLLVATRARSEALRAAKVLLIVELAQGTIGFVQYFTHLPIVLVGFHMLGAALVTATMTWALLAAREGRAAT
ncbi:MAG TPA: COX15/CtaA family protein [Marmoricola sp.]|jgi:cytochrome c oxidase assembly protein subunit 15|nr:COX15/CtaA family protein [Marmoricola sp.]